MSLTESTYAATLAGRSFRTLIAITARFDLELLKYDAVNAFVNARLEENMFMKMPPGHRRNGTILKLNKPLYGLRRSPLLWQTELTQTLKKLGLEPIPHERSSTTSIAYIVIAFRKHQETEARSLIKKLQCNLTGSIIDTKVDTWSFVGLADKYEYEYWSIFVFIFKDFGLNLIIFMFIDWLCLNMNIFTTWGAEEAQNRLYISFNSTKALCIN